MRHTGGVLRRSAETDAERFVFVFVEDGKQFRAGSVMYPESDSSADLFEVFFPQQGKAVFIHAVSFSYTDSALSGDSRYCSAGAEFSVNSPPGALHPPALIYCRPFFRRHGVSNGEGYLPDDK